MQLPPLGYLPNCLVQSRVRQSPHASRCVQLAFLPSLAFIICLRILLQVTRPFRHHVGGTMLVRLPPHPVACSLAFFFVVAELPRRRAECQAENWSIGSIEA